MIFQLSSASLCSDFALHVCPTRDKEIIIISIIMNYLQFSKYLLKSYFIPYLERIASISSTEQQICICFSRGRSLKILLGRLVEMVH